MKIVNDENTKFTRIMKSYYAFKPVRVLISFATFICQIMLLIYLMILPIQLAYHSLISKDQNQSIQECVDQIVCAFFTLHIFLYFDSNIQKIIKAPNSLPKYRIKRLGKWTRLITIQLIYDIITWGISVFMTSPQNNTFEQRILQLCFFFKIYKLHKFHKRTIYILIGTSIYPTYKIFFTVMVTFTVISYLSSFFYAIDYAILLYGGPLSDQIWIVNMGTQPNLIERPFWVQLLIINYWALGTSSTAAYGDICGLAPQQVVFNIFVLYFANFLYGYYLNNIQIIPKQQKQQQMKVLQQFDQFQKYNKLTNEDRHRKYKQIDNELYLKILCSIQYKESQKGAKKRIQRAIPSKYIEQIKLQIYSQFFNSESGRLYRSKGFFNKEQSLLRISKMVKESVCQKDQNIYQYKQIDETDLIYIHEGSFQLRLPRELSNMVSVVRQQGTLFGQYCFITNQKRKVDAIALEYVSVYLLKRSDYISCLSLQQSQDFNLMYGRCLQLAEELIQKDPYRIYNEMLQQNASFLAINKPASRLQKIQEVLNLRKNLREFSLRQNPKSKRIYLSQRRNSKKSVATQTEQAKQSLFIGFESVVRL